MEGEKKEGRKEGRERERRKEARKSKRQTDMGTGHPETDRFSALQQRGRTGGPSRTLPCRNPGGTPDPRQSA